MTFEQWAETKKFMKYSDPEYVVAEAAWNTAKAKYEEQLRTYRANWLLHAQRSNLKVILADAERLLERAKEVVERIKKLSEESS